MKRKAILQQIIKNKMYSIGSIICFLLACVDMSIQPPVSPIGILVSLIYCILLWTIVLSPFKSACALAMLSLACFIAPFTIDAPTIYWGSWYGLAIMSTAGESLVPTIAFAITNALISASSSIYAGMAIASAATMSSTFIVAACIGIYAHQRKINAHQKAKQLALESELKQKDRELHLLRYLHNNVVGDISYAISLIRLHNNNNLKNAEHTLLSVNQQIREAIKDSNTYIQNDNSANISNYTTEDLQIFLHRLDEKLKNLGFDGKCVIIGTTSLLSSDQINLLAEISSEIFNNIIKYGLPDHYTFVIQINAESGILLASSNVIDSNTIDSGSLGLKLIRESLESIHGSLHTNASNNVWDILINIPLQSKIINPMI
ncbi:sensor histidine kinase [Bifidobacterium vespertilionis]|uniref:Signal transduction histidine kinase subgroup 3 dimerisation and phosphoacceptor domain-containing protein n=1 Tax=Bifidobacterium vespertilionis TaxID=2562524 RepID=A0A5J5E1L3_9BIFI|nr:hypothetical protein [Bifidobacterium vespertilionis]KAA8818612.1 hypothetical protein EMO90_09560 [Bifidobacterium vespertilionis]KAA8823067.1 hypothetical protein EM848_06845 [Bifidobacterium vespertilionis]